jgi:hypothetical protein
MKPEQLRVRPTTLHRWACRCGYTSSARSARTVDASHSDHLDYQARDVADDIRIISEALERGRYRQP